MKNTNIKKGCASFCLVLACMLHLPFGFGKSASSEKLEVVVNNVVAATPTKSAVNLLYDQIKLAEAGLSFKAFALAMTGFENLKNAGKFTNDQVISIVDFTRSSAKKRLFVIDLNDQRILFNTYVAHGQNSGAEYAKHFSNKPESFQSSLGFYETAGTYQGRNGYSLQLIGLDKGWNDRADDRAIVMHGASYVSETQIRNQGYIGRSWGCPAVPMHLTRPIIDKIKNGTCLFIYAEHKGYFKKSNFLNHS